MAAKMQRFGTSEEDDDEMGMDMREEDDDDDDEEKNMVTPAVVGVDVGILSTSVNNRYMHHQQYQDQPTPQGGARRCRPQEEKERTKLRERQRRAITAKILAGLRRHGNYNLRVRADINDVIAALAREAGWVVLPDGTTFPARSEVLITLVEHKLCKIFILCIILEEEVLITLVEHKLLLFNKIPFGFKEKCAKLQTQIHAASDNPKLSLKPYFDGKSRHLHIHVIWCYTSSLFNICRGCELLVLHKTQP